MICPPTLGNDSAKKAEIFGRGVINRQRQCQALAVFHYNLQCVKLKANYFMEGAQSYVKVYLATLPVDLLYQVFYCVGICLAWVGVIPSVYASVGVR